ncbi:MAG: tetratricopeptide repeat protein [Candidatus Cloacimonetes bacterium]|nr:tetratricopeptide repeat protein [Candidatus Cloacimonadota bacterium]
MALWEGFAVSGIYRVISKLFGKDKELRDKVFQVFLDTEKVFFEEFRDKYKKPLDSFLTREENLKLLLNIVYLNRKDIESTDFNPNNYDETPPATIDELDFLIKEFNKSVEKDWELSNLQYTKKVYEKMLEKVTEENKSTKYLTNPPMQDTVVIGRDFDLKQISKKLDADRSLLLMNGLGGIGKTTLARKYLVEFDDVYDHIVWLDISQGVVEAFAGSNVLHSNLGLIKEIETLKTEDAFALIMNKLKNMDGINLMILDDAKEDFVSIRKQLPGKPNWRLLVTSRQNFIGIKPYYLDFLDPEDAKQLFYEYYTIEKDDDLLEKIFEPVKYHTLVVELFAKMAEMNECTLIELAEKADAEGITISIHTNVDVDHSTENIENIQKYLIRTFPVNELPEKLILILRKLAIMPSVYYDISDLDSFLLIEDEEKGEYNLNLNKLVKLGWITKRDKMYKLHEMIRKMIFLNNPPSYKFYGNYIVNIINLCDCEDIRYDLREINILLPISLEIINNIEEDNEIFSELYFNIANFYQILGKFSTSISFYRKALTIAEKLDDDESQDIIRSNLAESYRILGNYEIAKELCEAVLHSALMKSGNIHPSVAIRKSNLANVYSDLGYNERAKDLQEEALESDIANYGLKDVNVARCQSNLANVYMNLGKYEIARDLLHSALKSYLERYGNYHPTVANCQSNLANAYIDLGDYDKAQYLLEASLKSDLETFGEMHPEVATRKSNLAIVYEYLGYYKQAKKLHEAALESDLKNFGKRSHKVAIRKSNLANIYRIIGDYEKARELMESALKSDLDNFGEKHPSTAKSYNNIGHLQLLIQNYLLAIFYFLKSLEIAQDVWGEEHPKTKIISDTVIHTLKEITERVVTEKINFDFSDMNRIKQIKVNHYQDIGDYFNFLEAISKKEAADKLFKGLNPEYKKIYSEVQGDIKQRKLLKQRQEIVSKVIKSHNHKLTEEEKIIEKIKEMSEKKEI